MRSIKRDNGMILHLPDVPQRPIPQPGAVLECTCARVMGMDFYFLPTGVCCRPDKRCDRET